MVPGEVSSHSFLIYKLYMTAFSKVQKKFFFKEVNFIVNHPTLFPRDNQEKQLEVDSSRPYFIPLQIDTACLMMRFALVGACFGLV